MSPTTIVLHVAWTGTYWQATTTLPNDVPYLAIGVTPQALVDRVAYDAHHDNWPAPYNLRHPHTLEQ